MKSRLSYVLFVVCLSFLSLSLSRCTGVAQQQNYCRVYSGDLLPRNNVAIILLGNACYIQTIEEEGEAVKRLAMISLERGRELELLPGLYTLHVGYFNINAGINTIEHSKKTFPIQVVALSGRVYFIHLEFPAFNRWKPVIIDNITDKDFESIANKAYRNGVWNHVELILQGKRRQIKWDDRGFWW